MATKYCPQCQTSTKQTLLLCPQCQAVLSLKDPYSLVGQTLLDRYHIEALVGLGGMGAVYCAFHIGIERRVAFKVLQPNIALADERLIDLFEREAKVAGRLTHENIVDVKDAGRVPHASGNLAYIVMEWLDGRTLEDELANDGQLNFAQTNEILQQMAGALAEAHAKNVVHRDLKPANVMLLNRPTAKNTQNQSSNILVKVLDFGIGKIVDESSTSVSAVMGTPSYASPEQLQLGSKLDHRSDIYSLGVMLYRMLSGRLPFNGQTLSELVQMQLTVLPEPLSTHRPDVPPAIETLIHRMLAKDPAMRPSSVQEVAATFAAGLQGSHLKESASLAWVENAPTLPQARIPVVPNKNKTELMPDAPTPRRFEIAAPAPETNTGTQPTVSQAPVATKRFSPVAALVLAIVFGGGAFALYRYAFNAGASQQTVTTAQLNNNNAAVENSPVASAPPLAAANDKAPGEINPTSSATPKTKPEVKPSPTPAAAVSNTTTPPTPTVTKQATPAPANSSLPIASAPSANQAPSNVSVDAEPATGRWPVADGLYNNALRQYEAGNYKAALDLCDKALAIRPMHRGARQLKMKLNSGMKILQGRP